MSANIQELGFEENEKKPTPGHMIEIEDLENTAMENRTAHTFPEGGYQAWATVLGGFLVQCCAFGYVGSFGVFQGTLVLGLSMGMFSGLRPLSNFILNKDYYVRIRLTNKSPSTIAWIGSIMTFLIVALGIPVGRLYDRGYFYHLMWAGSFLVSFSLFMLSLTKPNQYYQVLLSQGFGAGIGIGMIYVPSVAIQSHYFNRRRSLIMTLAASGSAVGSIIQPIMLNNLLSTTGFANATRANAGLISGLLFASCLLMRTSIPPVAAMPDFKQALFKFSKDKAYVCCSLGLVFFAFGLFFPVFFLQLDAIRHNLSERFAFYLVVIMSGGSLLGCLTAGILTSDFRMLSVRVEIIMIIASACYGALLFVSDTMSSIASITVMALIYGFFPGIFTSLAAPMVSNLSDDVSEIGMRMGIGFTLSSLADLFAGPIDGALLTRDNHWRRPAAFSGIMALIACFLLVAMTFFMRKTGGKTKGNP